MGREKSCGVKDKLSGAKCTKDTSHTDPNAHRDNSDPGCVISWVDWSYKPAPANLGGLLPACLASGSMTYDRVGGGDDR